MGKLLEFQVLHHSFQRNPRADLLQNGLAGSPCSPRDSQESSPTESKRLFYTSVSLLLSCIQGYHYHLSKFHIYALVCCIGPITSWEIDGETVETASDFIFLGSKISADGDCSHEIKRCLLLGRKVMTNLDSIFISRDITLLTKVCLVKAMVFPVVMYGCESWTVKKTECRRIDVFELWRWRRLLKVPWTARRSN